jgi:hypothetical protein
MDDQFASGRCIGFFSFLPIFSPKKPKRFVRIRQATKMPDGAAVGK